MWGRYDIDRFASHYNTKVPTFCSRFWNPGCSAIDAFTEHWGGTNNWIVPPVYLVSRVLKHMKVCKAKGTLVVPAWYSASFWPLLCPRGMFIPEVIDFVYLPRDKEAYIPSRIAGGLFGERDLAFDMLAINMKY